METITKVKEKSIEEYAKNNSLKGKKVLLRIDVNVPLGSNGTVDPGEDWRILKSLSTINFLVERGAIVILLSHIGRDPKESLRPVFEYMSKHMTLGFIPDYEDEIIQSTISKMQHGSAVMLENVRSCSGEKLDDTAYLQNITNFCDIYVNDAFSVSHRKHASVSAVTKLLPSYFGIQFVNEIVHISKIFDSNGVKTLILGGAKFGTKLDLLEKMLPHLSHVLIGGALANVFLKARGFEVGKSFVDDVDVSSMLDNDKIILLTDCVDQDGDLLPVDEINENDIILDIGHETEELFEQVIAASDLVLWNGPMGKYEDGYTSGSIAVANSISHSNAFSITGGGDTATVILQENLQDNFDFISTGGGAMLDFIVEGNLHGISVIE